MVSREKRERIIRITDAELDLEIEVSTGKTHAALVELREVRARRNRKREYKDEEILDRLELATDDFSTSELFAQCYLELPREKQTKFDFIARALRHSAIVAYARPFINSNNRAGQSGNILGVVDLLAGLSESETEFHALLMELRHAHVAHSDATNLLNEGETAELTLRLGWERRGWVSHTKMVKLKNRAMQLRKALQEEKERRLAARESRS